MEGTRAFGWAAAFSVALMNERVRSAAEGSVKFSEAKAALKELKADFDVRRMLLDDKKMLPLGAAIDQIVSDAGEEALPVHVLAVVLHYSNLASGGRQLSLHAMLEDLSFLVMQDPLFASLCAYCIGRSMENVAVTTLLYQSNPERYEALAPGRCEQQLNVMRRAAEKCENQRTPPSDVVAEPDPSAKAVPDSGAHNEVADHNSTAGAANVNDPSEPSEDTEKTAARPVDLRSGVARIPPAS